MAKQESTSTRGTLSRTEKSLLNVILLRGYVVLIIVIMAARIAIVALSQKGGALHNWTKPGTGPHYVELGVCSVFESIWIGYAVYLVLQLKADLVAAKQFILFLSIQLLYWICVVLWLATMGRWDKVTFTQMMFCVVMVLITLIPWFVLIVRHTRLGLRIAVFMNLRSGAAPVANAA